MGEQANGLGDLFAQLLATAGEVESLARLGRDLGGCALFIGGIFSTLKNSEPAERSLEMIARDPAVIAELGSPVEQGWMVGGNINLANADGHAGLHHPVSGPSGSGSARLLATRSANRWTFDEITVTIDGSGKVIDVLNPPEPNVEKAE